MTTSILKGEANNNSKEGAVSSHSGLGPGSAPVSVVVDVVTHDEPSVCSAMSNGGLTQHEHSVSDYQSLIRSDIIYISEETRGVSSSARHRERECVQL